MSTQQITFQLYPCGTETITLPALLTSDAFERIESAIGDALREPRHDSSTHAPGGPAAIELDVCRLAQY